MARLFSLRPSTALRASRALVEGRGPARAAPDPHFGDAASLHLEHFHREVVHVEGLADVRHVAQVREKIPAERFEPLALNLNAEAIAYFVHVHLSAEDERPVAFVG